MKAPHWQCRWFGHKAVPAPFQLGQTGVVGFILVCTRCGMAINAYPTHRDSQDIRDQPVEPKDAE